MLRSSDHKGSLKCSLKSDWNSDALLGTSLRRPGMNRVIFFAQLVCARLIRFIRVTAPIVPADILLQFAAPDMGAFSMSQINSDSSANHSWIEGRPFVAIVKILGYN